MGNMASTRWAGHRRLTVEEVFVLDIQAVAEALPSPIRTGVHWLGTVPVWRAGIDLLLVSFELDTRHPDLPWLLLWYTHPESQQRTTSRIMLATTRLPYNRLRWWLTCPAIQRSPLCHQVKRKLYLVPGVPTFSCRLCANLTYVSCQQEHSRYRDYGPECRELLARAEARKKALAPRMSVRSR